MNDLFEIVHIAVGAESLIYPQILCYLDILLMFQDQTLIV